MERRGYETYKGKEAKKEHKVDDAATECTDNDTTDDEDTDPFISHYAFSFRFFQC